MTDIRKSYKELLLDGIVAEGKLQHQHADRIIGELEIYFMFTCFYGRDHSSRTDWVSCNEVIPFPDDALKEWSIIQLQEEILYKISDFMIRGLHARLTGDNDPERAPHVDVSKDVHVRIGQDKNEKLILEFSFYFCNVEEFTP